MASTDVLALAACGRLRDNLESDGDSVYVTPIPGVPGKFFTSDEDVRAVLEYAEHNAAWKSRYYELQSQIAEWKHQTNCQTPADAGRHIEACQGVIEDIANDFNINEGADGESISPGHKRCVDLANEFIQAVTARKEKAG